MGDRGSVRATTEADHEAFVRAALPAFGTSYDDTPRAQQWWHALEMDRGLVIEDDGRVVATTGAYTFDLTVPGLRQVPVAGVTCVSVLPTHRRRGLFTALMRRQLQDLRDRGEAVAVLLASEATIYRRCGYGPATTAQTWTVEVARGAFLEPVPDDGRLELSDRRDAGSVMAEVYTAWARGRQGALGRPARLWEVGAGMPPVSTEHRFVIVHRDADGVPDGYASYAIHDDRAGGNGRTLLVDEVVAPEERVRAVLARYCLDHDLVDTVRFARVAVDDPLRWRLADVRAAQTARSTDWLWVRLLDVPAALAARGYTGSGSLVLQVEDPFCPDLSGTFALDVEDGEAKCARVEDAAPDLRLDVADLGSAYLGGVPFTGLVLGGRVTECTPGAAALADRLCTTSTAPLCLHWF
ncbi:GNAT family N-acetyltransferase [Oryzihumus sp.]|uniref:GNAT family N-acetyltransferase n=1 Tax=Oryzihumus sp. TaxID=1968903 RepID=UPI002ED96C41